eukprot:gene29735-38876_t
MKRIREGVDGQISKEEFHSVDHVLSEKVGEFSRAAPEVVSQRRLVTARRGGLTDMLQQESKKEQFLRHVAALNKSFFAWFTDLTQDKDKGKDGIDFIDGFQDYIDYASKLEDRFLRSYGEVLTFGSGDCGQLAHGIEEDEDLMVKYPRVVYSLRDKKVYGIACGGIHNAVYTTTGQVYTWGCADDGALGRVGEEFSPLLVQTLANETIIGVDCGDCHTIAVSTKGEVWGWGCYKAKEGNKFFNPNEQDPKRNVEKQQDLPIRITGLPSNVVDIACGAVFNLARTADGAVYSWGLGECGELGRTVADIPKKYNVARVIADHLTPNRMYVEGDEDQKKPMGGVKSIGCGAYHCMVVSVGDTVYGSGLNNYGQLGLGDVENRSKLAKITALDGHCIVSVKGGFHHSLALSNRGKLFAFGRSDSSQLGISNKSSSAGDFSANEVYTWGYGDMLALGHGEEKDEMLPRKLNFSKAKIKNITITQVAAGGQHSAIIGQVYTV